MNAYSPSPEAPSSPETRPFEPTPGQSAFYFLSSLFAAGGLALMLAGVRASGVSHFEGASGYAFIFSLVGTYPLCLLSLWVAYLWFRRSAFRMDLALFGSVVLSLGCLLTCGSLF